MYSREECNINRIVKALLAQLEKENIFVFSLK